MVQLLNNYCATEPTGKTFNGNIPVVLGEHETKKQKQKTNTWSFLLIWFKWSVIKHMTYGWRLTLLCSSFILYIRMCVKCALFWNTSCIYFTSLCGRCLIRHVTLRGPLIFIYDLDTLFFVFLCCIFFLF